MKQFKKACVYLLIFGLVLVQNSLTWAKTTNIEGNSVEVNYNIIDDPIPERD